MATIMITGGAGYVGSQLVEYLTSPWSFAGDNEVVVLDMRTPSVEFKGSKKLFSPPLSIGGDFF